jgi:2-keto-3-deoxy-L-rhamnonate aldolase RhmA
MLSKEALKQRIRKGEVVVGVRVSVEFDRSQIEYILSQGSYDFLYLDGQHSPYSEEGIVSLCAIAQALDIPVQFRIPHTRQTYLVGRYLDFGLSGIMVPEVIEEASVEEAVTYFYYPQMGRRSWGGPARVGINSRSKRLEYAEWWNDYGFLSMQLESLDAIINAYKLAKPGVDFLAFGPNDLSFNLEGYVNPPLKTVDDCMRHVAEQVKGSSIRLGMGTVTTPAERDKYLEMGVTVFQEAPKLPK